MAFERPLLDRETARRALFALTLANLLPAWLLTHRLVTLAGPTVGVKHAIFLNAAVLGQIAALFVLVALLLLLLTRARAGLRVLPVAAPVLFGLLGFFLLIDVAIYGHYKFHVNGLVISVLFSPVMRDAMDVEASNVAWVVGIGVALVVAEGILFGWLRRRVAPKPWRPRWVALAAIPAALLLVEKTIYATSDLWGERHVIRSARAVPLYVRTTARNFAQHFGWAPRKMATVRVRPVDPSAHTLKYPKVPLEFDEPPTRPNIVWLNLEGWRWDMFSEENTPNLWRWSRGEQVFDYHISGGNRTATGVFSQFYGLYGNYWDTFLSERRSPVLVDRLQALGYRIDADASREVGFFDMQSSTFVKMPEVYHFEWETNDSAIRDQAIVRHLQRFVESAVAEGKPFFHWSLFDSSHVKYYFPPEFAKFEPYAKEVEYREIGISEQRRIEAKNRYRNAVLWEDHLVGRVLDWLKEKKLLDTTVVIVTGDHGEEFYENGHWTHGGGCTPEVVRVPLIVHVPGRTPATFSHVTSHHDLVPTLMEMLGTTNPASDYSLGRSLFGEERVPHVVACGWDQSALVDESGWLIFGNDFQNPLDYEVRDPAYREVPDASSEVEKRTAHVASAIRNMNAFLK